MPKLAAKGTGKTAPLSLLMTRKLRRQIEAAAAASGRSIAQEVEFRLEQSFWGRPRPGYSGYEVLNIDSPEFFEYFWKQPNGDQKPWQQEPAKHDTTT